MSSTATRVRRRDTLDDPPPEPVRRPRRWLRVLRTILLLVVIAGVLVTAGWVVFVSPYLAVREVTVTGQRSLDPDEIRTATAVPLGRPLARLDLAQLTRQATGVRAVESVSVARRWPNTVAIRIVERRPLLAVPQPNGYAVVDRLGVAYAESATLPKDVVVANVNPDNAALLVDVGIVADALPKGLRTQVERLQATTRNDISMTLDSGLTVVWGTSAESALKARLTTTLLKRDPRTSIDVSSPHTPAVR